MKPKRAITRDGKAIAIAGDDPAPAPVPPPDTRMVGTERVTDEEWGRACASDDVPEGATEVVEFRCPMCRPGDEALHLKRVFYPTAALREFATRASHIRLIDPYRRNDRRVRCTCGSYLQWCSAEKYLPLDDPRVVAAMDELRAHFARAQVEIERERSRALHEEAIPGALEVLDSLRGEVAAASAAGVSAADALQSISSHLALLVHSHQQTQKSFADLADAVRLQARLQAEVVATVAEQFATRPPTLTPESTMSKKNVPFTGTSTQIQVNDGSVAIHGGASPDAAPLAARMFGQLSREAKNALWQSGAAQVNEEGAALIGRLLCEMLPAAQADLAPQVAAFFASAPGVALAGIMLGMALEFAPISGARKARLASELRTGAMRTGSKALMAKVMSPLRNFLFTDLPALVAGLPEPEEEAAETTGVRADAGNAPALTPSAADTHPLGEAARRAQTQQGT